MRVRAPVVVGFLGAAFLLVGSGLNLLGGAYAQYAEGRLDQAESESTTQASRLSALLTPWNARRQGLYGWVLTERHQGEEAETRYLTALRWAPADPLLWAEYALSLARSGRFDESLLHAIRRAQTLAPHSPAVQNSIAAIGLSYWRRGTQELRERWLMSMRYERDHNRQTFLDQVVTRGQALTFCTDAAPRLGEQQWCATVRRRVEECRQHYATEDYSLCVASP